MKISNNKIFITCIFVFIVYFLFSLVVFKYYDAGDQIAYRYFYSGMRDLSFKDGLVFYKNSLDSSEPGYFLLVYIFSSFIEKDILLSFLNGIFIFLLFYHLIKLQVSNVVLLLLSCNYYIFVLLFSAERLKLSLLILLLGWCFYGKGRKIIYLSVFTHVQSAIIILLLQLERFDDFLLKLNRARLGYVNKNIIGLFSLLILGCVFTYFMWGHIYHKITTYYTQWSGFDSVFKPMVFTLLSMVYAKENKFQAFIIGSIMSTLSVLLGGERLVIFSYFAFLYYGLQYNKGMNFGVIITSIYFTLKGMLFIFNVINTGDGFVSYTGGYF
ncbi:hypothetical protein [Aeromonas sp. 1HA1]|uniref:hypothetical protein n=1 Tax=Aeromonas sp. 1HA1 TaxID=2699193 RepID=UPI0023DD6B3B|nr:hypothetical protein [Aeromonas sp. 1HA1]MDF2414980.1 hypothetical protein [Aeromonas sp. 1HA1]